jgi:hypothetical protein
MSDNISDLATAPYIKYDSPEVKDVCYFADRFWYVLELKIKKLKTIAQNSNNHYESDMAMIRIQALEWVQGDLISCSRFLSSVIQKACLLK